jgi:AcrR family transcriptional regulator
VTARTRLEPELRRQQLLEVAAHKFAAQPYQDVSMSGIAAEAGVSRALLYRYYPTKRDLFGGVYQAAADRLVEASAGPPDGSITARVLAGLDAHFDFFETNARTVLVANRGELAGDPVIEAIITDELANLRRSILDTMGLDGHRRFVASTALYGWLTFVRAVCVEWLVERKLTRAEVRDMCLRTLVATLDLEPADIGDRQPCAKPKV